MKYRGYELKQSGIRATTIRCNELGGINLGQGVCDLPTPDAIKKASVEAILNNCNTYAPYNGIHSLRTEIYRKARDYNNIDLDSEEQVLVSSGSTGAYVAAIKTLLSAGDQVIIFEPFYGYHKQILDLHQVKLITIPIDVEENFSFNIDYMKSAITNETKVIVLCNPSNPSGKIFSEMELRAIGDLANKYDLYIITDEIYEYVTYLPHYHISIGSIKDYSNRVITISGLSKTYHMTGWRIGYAVGPKDIIKKMGLIHDILYICSPTPLQHAGVIALQQNSDYYDELRNGFLEKRNYLVKSLTELGFKVSVPQGAYYLMADYRGLNLSSDSDEAASQILEQAKVATISAKYFYLNKDLALNKLRFCFATSQEKLRQGMNRLRDFFN